MSSIIVEALGGFHFSATAGGHQVQCDLPDESREDKGMTPTELFLSALGCCAGIYIFRFCEKHSIQTKGMKIQVSGKSAKDPSRIGKILFEIDMPTPIPEELRNAVIRTAKTCYLHNTIKNLPEMEYILK